VPSKRARPDGDLEEEQIQTEKRDRRRDCSMGNGGKRSRQAQRGLGVLRGSQSEASRPDRCEEDNRAEGDPMRV